MYTFWKCCKTQKEELCAKLYKQINAIDKETFTQLRNKIITEENELEKAIMYFIINRCSFSGATLSGGFSKSAAKDRFTRSSIDRIKQLDLSNTYLYNLDFTEFFKLHEDGLFFIDPPYYLGTSSNLYGNN